MGFGCRVKKFTTLFVEKLPILHTHFIIQSLSLYKEYIEQLQISEKNEGDEFMQSLRCSNIYVPDTKEVTEKYRKQAAEQGIDAEWIEKYMPAAGAKDETV